MNFQKVSIVLLSILLTSCVSNQKIPVSNQSTMPATKTATEIVSTQTLTFQPTETSTPIFTPIATVTPLKLSKEEINNALKQHDYEKFCDNSYYRSWSPDNQWFMAGCERPVVAQIVNLNTGTIYSLDISYYYPLSYRFSTTIQDELWSADGRYLFIRPHICCADGPAAIVDGVALYRVDLTNGNVWTVLPPSTTKWEDYAFAFSPDENHLAYVSPFESNVLHVLDLTMKEEVTKVFDKMFLLGGLVWTQDGKQIVLLGQTRNDDSYTASLFLLNTKDLSFEALIDNDPRRLVPDRYPTAWIKKDVIRLFSFADETHWAFNIKTKSLEPILLPSP